MKKLKELKNMSKKERKKEIRFYIDTAIAVMLVLFIFLNIIVPFIGWTISGGLFATICGFALAILVLFALL